MYEHRAINLIALDSFPNKEQPNSLTSQSLEQQRVLRTEANSALVSRLCAVRPSEKESSLAVKNCGRSSENGSPHAALTAEQGREGLRLCCYPSLTE
mmetsp:Transcript_6592/g.28148  ORF Transcript_6592/g.28148 Transcript_6592/m.28148 type:complete len:97 (-) Transcript_6592:1866-2156(-)